MNQEDMTERAGRLIYMIEKATGAAKNKTDEQMGEMLSLGLTLLAELLLDIKRIAEKKEHHFHYHVPEGSSLAQEGSVVVIKPGPV